MRRGSRWSWPACRTRAPRATPGTRARRPGWRAGAASWRPRAGARSRNAPLEPRRQACARQADRAGGARSCSRRAPGAAPRPGIRSESGYSFDEAVEAVALTPVARAADVGELYPARSRRVELLLRAALDEKQRARLGLQHVERAQAQAGMVVERRRLRHAELLRRDAAGARRDPGAQLERHRAVALLVVGPGHPQHRERSPQ